jgi:hypothetical protein
MTIQSDQEGKDDERRRYHVITLQEMVIKEDENMTGRW